MQFEAAFRRWVGSILPALGADAVVAIDGKSSRRTGKVDATPLHLVSAFAAGAGLVLGQRATAAKSNEKTAIPELLASLALKGCIVTLDAMGTQTNIAQAIRNHGAHYVLALKDNQPNLADSLRDFFARFKVAPDRTPHAMSDTVEKDHGRIETQREIKGKTTFAQRYYLSSLAPDANRLLRAIRAHWSIENRLHWVLDVCFREDECRVRKEHAPRNFATLRKFALNLLRQDTRFPKRSLRSRRKATERIPEYRAALLGLTPRG